MRGRIFLIGALLAMAGSADAQDALPSFTDVPETREDFMAIEDLRDREILQGRPDGTFGPGDLVNRAEAVTIVVRAVANVRNLPPMSDCFPDVRGRDWYVRPVCYAEDLEWIGGYPDGTFQPIRAVSKGEFLKILLNAYGVDLEPLAEMNDPLATDASDARQWYFPYLAYALLGSMTRPDASGNLHPGAPLTRGNVALLMHRFLFYREGQRNDALLGDAFEDIERALDLLVAGDGAQAGFASARARLLARGAYERLPGEALVQATFAIADALAALVQSSRADSDALALAQEAYRKADEAASLSTEVQTLADRIRTMAHDRAEHIRSGGSE